jgi:hypothetical protein
MSKRYAKKKIRDMDGTVRQSWICDLGTLDDAMLARLKESAVREMAEWQRFDEEVEGEILRRNDDLLKAVCS